MLLPSLPFIFSLKKTLSVALKVQSAMIDYIGAFLQVRSDTYNQVSFYYLLPFNELSVK